MKRWIVVMGFLMVPHMPAEAKPVDVQLKEGVTQGYIKVSVPAGETIAEGEVSQVAAGAERVVGRMLLRFHNGSHYDETVIFSQNRTFKLLRYSVEQKGPSFPDAFHFELDGATGAYTITELPHSKERPARTGKLELPPDVYNGMTVTLLKNLPESGQVSFHMLSIGRTPALFPVVVRAEDVETVKTGERKGEALHYTLRPTVGWFTRSLAWLFSETIPEYNFWLIKHDVPAFARFEGSLYRGGPIWRIEQVSPRMATGR